MLCPFHCKARPPGSSLQCPELENIPQVPRNRDEVGQNNDSRKAVLAPLWVWKWSRAIFRSRSSKVSVQKLCCAHFTAKQGPQEVVYSPRNWKMSSKFREMDTKLVKITIRVRRSWLLFQSESKVGLYFGPEARHWAFKKFSSLNFTENQGHHELV